MAAWKHPPRPAHRPWIDRHAPAILALFAALLIAGFLAHIATKAIQQAAFDAVQSQRIGAATSPGSAMTGPGDNPPVAGITFYEVLK